jgi:hypothetical protein
MAAPFWRSPEESNDFRVSCSAVIEGVRFLDPEAVFNPGTSPQAHTKVQNFSAESEEKSPFCTKRRPPFV